MVTTELSPLSLECSNWRSSLREYRHKIQSLKQQLPQMTDRYHDKEDLLQIDHFENQFHIQLVNIHDLKQMIKNHEKSILLDPFGAKGVLQEKILADHAHLLDDYQILHQTMDELIGEYDIFLKQRT